MMAGNGEREDAGARDALGRERAFSEAHAEGRECVLDGGNDGGGCRDGAAVARPLDASFVRSPHAHAVIRSMDRAPGRSRSRYSGRIISTHRRAGKIACVGAA
jgi:hypothetical protein